MKITKFLSICAILASAFTFSACNSETSGTYQTIIFVNYGGTTADGFCQYVYSDPTGGFSGGSNTGSTITFLSKTIFSEGKTPAIGTRLIGQFTITLGEELKNGTILDNSGIAGLSKFGNVDIETLDAAPQSNPIYIQSLLPSGKYLDIVALAASQNSDLRLVCDQSSLNSDTAVLYLVYECNALDAVETQYFASFDLSSVLNLTNIKNIKLVANSSNGSSEYTFPVKQ
ncbi:MAG: hypothetical protein K2G09_00665 [Paramuribaculum sp.]|nr:hypothetical protein [Paramuribaculum sp.]